MVCQACGTPASPETRFCSRCGAQIVAQPSAPPSQYPPAPVYSGQPVYAMPVVPRVQRNLQTVGILWCVYAAYRVIWGLIGMMFMSTVFHWNFSGRWPLRPFNSEVPLSIIHGLLPFVAIFTVLGAALALATGFSLLTRKPWGRILAIVAGVLALFKFPLGTALGIYTLYVFAPTQSGFEYDSIADRT